MKFDRLKSSFILKNVRIIAGEIAADFPASGLSELGEEVATVAKEAAGKAEDLEGKQIRADRFLNIASTVVAATAFGVIVWLAVSWLRRDTTAALPILGHVGDLALVLAAFWLSSRDLISRSKRKIALAELNRLRSVAHVIDSHQFGKYPTRLTVEAGTTKDDKSLARYLQHCIRLLAVIEKSASLFAQAVNDRQVLDVVSEVEQLCLGLSNQLFLKIDLLDLPNS